MNISKRETLLTYLLKTPVYPEFLVTRELYLTDNHRLTDVSTGQVKVFDHLHCFFVSIEEGELEILLYF